MTLTPLAEYAGWIFDLDDTLTVVQHDFAGLRRTLGLAPDGDILELIAARPDGEKRDLTAALQAWEWSAASQAELADGAYDLLSWVSSQGLPAGIVTRNRRDIALHTLETVGLAGFFEPSMVLGRDEARPKPAPDGPNYLLGRWALLGTPVMVGDYVYDLQAGRAAGCETILVGEHCPSDWLSYTDRVVSSLGEIVRSLQSI